MPDGAVDVRDPAAPAADEMVMVVTDPGLVAGGTARRFDPAEKPSAVQRVQRLVDGLQGDLADPSQHAPVDGVRVEVVALPHGLHDRQPGGGDTQPGVTEPVAVLHGRRIMSRT
nr:hypothetical protein GCM10020093_081440 [Planobispora longispora]